MSATRRTLALLLPLFALGCASAQSAQPALRAPEQEGEQSWRSSDDALALTMRAVANQLESAGLKPARDAFRGFLTAGARATHGLDVPAQSCVTLIAIASRGVHDMDAALYSPDGDVLAIDSQPDAHPTIQVCTGNEPRTLYYALQVYEGAGTFLMAAFSGQQSTLDAAAKVLGARPTVARLGYSEPDGPGRVAAFRDGLLRRGFQSIVTPLRVPLVQDQSIRAPLAVEPGECYTVAGFALDGLTDVNLRVLDDEGAEVARDGSQEVDASAQFCAERHAEYATELQGAHGAGNALLLLFRVDAASIGGQSGLWLGERPLARASTMPLDQAIAEITHRAEQDGYKHARTLRTGQIAPGGVIAQQMTLPAKHCARIHAVGGPGVRALDLVAIDAAGHRLADASGGPETTYVHICGAALREVTLQAHAAAGSGPLALTVHEAPMATVTPAGTDEQLAAALQQAFRQARDAGYHPHAEFKAGPHRVSLRQSEPMSLKLQSDASRCMRAYLVSSDSSARAELYVEGKPVDELAGDGQAARFCAPDGTATTAKPFELRLTSGLEHGDAWLMVLER